MRKLNLADHKRAFAVILVVMVFSAVLFSAFYMASEAEHRCTENACPICEYMEVCEHFLQQMGSDGVVVLSAVTAVVLLLLICMLTHPVFSLSTLVSAKVRLDT